jgi:2,3-bisphosphoglycerate-independent phosphoglycerate mutase
MRYFILIPDGMADFPVKELGGVTPMRKADKPAMDSLAARSVCGTVSNVPDGMVPESDTANLSILSYDPKIYSKGRSPLEAASMGLQLGPEDTALRCNLVTLSDDGDYDDKIMLDHSADEITTEEADRLVAALNDALANDERRLYTGVSYRHCLVWRGADETTQFMRPHDILGQRITDYLPKDEFYAFMRASWDMLEHHPVNEARRSRGLRPANSAWLWSPGRKPSLPSFYDKWHLRASVVSAVDLIKGIAKCAGMEVVDVEGATGNIHTNFAGKAEAAIDAFKRGAELVYVHVEAPDECGHRGEAANKVMSIEYIDSKILSRVEAYLAGTGELYKIMVLPDHPTPIATRTHAPDPVPFFIYSSERDSVLEPRRGVSRFDEEECAKTGLYLPHGHELMKYFIEL